jgi:triosephosphate isomerase
MEKRLFLVANWKSHKKLDEAEAYLRSYAARSNHRVIVCPPMPYLVTLFERAREKGLSLGAQDVSNFPYGAYTGAVCAEMLKGVVEYVMVGHSERRRYFGETNDVVANKAKLALEAGITPILCVDQPYLEAQLAFFEADELKKMVVAYEPLAAIGSGQADSPEAAERVAERVRQLTQVEVPVIYGGSVEALNVKAFVEQANIMGVLVGGASLEVETWQTLVEAVS